MTNARRERDRQRERVVGLQRPFNRRGSPQDESHFQNSSTPVQNTESQVKRWVAVLHTTWSVPERELCEVRVFKERERRTERERERESVA